MMKRKKKITMYSISPSVQNCGSERGASGKEPNSEDYVPAREHHRSQSHEALAIHFPTNGIPYPSSHSAKLEPQSIKRMLAAWVSGCMRMVGRDAFP
jgi:hypothetical protein